MFSRCRSVCVCVCGGRCEGGGGGFTDRRRLVLHSAVFTWLTAYKPPRRFAPRRLDADDVLGRSLWAM